MEQTQIGGGSEGVWRGMEREECDKTGKESRGGGGGGEE